MATMRLLTAVKKERLHEGAVAQIKTLIASARLKVGEKLPPERELARRLQVSRVVAREALRSLELSGFIEIRPGATGGAFVANNLYKPVASCVRDLLSHGKLTAPHFVEVRRALECASVALAAASATRHHIRGLRAINKRLLADLGDNARLREHNAAFHIAIAELSGNPLITLLVQSLMELLSTVYPRPMQSAEFIKDTFDRHEAIVDAMEKRDVALCQELMAGDTAVTGKLRRP